MYIRNFWVHVLPLVQVSIILEDLFIVITFILPWKKGEKIKKCLAQSKMED